MPDPVFALTARIVAFRPADAAEAGHREAIASLLRGGGRPFSADNFEPGHVTGSALVVAPERHAVLFVFHTALRRWLQPGGHMEPGETDPRETAVREVLEETGLAVRAEEVLFDVDVHVIPARGSAPAHCHFDVRYLGLVEGLPPPVAAGVEAARWFTRAEAARLDLDGGMVRMLEKAEARGLI